MIFALWLFLAPPSVDAKQVERDLRVAEIMAEAKAMLARHRAQAWMNMKNKTMREIGGSI